MIMYWMTIKMTIVMYRKCTAKLLEVLKKQKSQIIWKEVKRTKKVSGTERQQIKNKNVAMELNFISTSN